MSSGAQHTENGSGKLVRTVGLFALIVYGVGDMVGAGIYGTIGKAAGAMGNAVWLAFVVSMIAALLTGLTYASLASRYPRAAGSAYISQRAFGWPFLSYVVGLTVTASGLTSMATGSRVFAENIAPFLGNLPLWVYFSAFIVLLALINLRGIKECVWVNILCTTIEVGGLLLIIGVSIPYVGSVNYLETPPDAGGLSAGLIMSGAVLTFYAFVGFEDLLNLAEEVKNPQRTMPWGIILAVLCATILYVLISIAAISVVPYANLADSKLGAPMAQITKVAAPWMNHHIYTGITLFAVANTALMNFIMGSRLVYGMANQGLLPRVLGAVHPTRHTPHVAILILGAIVLGLAFVGDIGILASATSLLLLAIFAMMNAALIVLKSRKTEPHGSFEVPYIVPILGFFVCAGLIYSRIVDPTANARSPIIAGVMVAIISALYFVLRPKVTEVLASEEPAI